MIFSLYIVTVIILLFSFINFVKKLSSKDYNNKALLITLIIIYSIIYIKTINLIATEVSTLITLFIIFIFSKLFFEINTKDLIYYSIIEWSIAIILDILTMNVFNNVINVDNIMIFKMLGSLIISIAFIVLSSIQCVLNFFNKIKEKLYKINYYLIILFVLVIIYVSLASFCLRNIYTISILTTILIISIFFLFWVIVFIFLQAQIVFLKENIKLLTKNNEFYIERIDEYRIIKHNLISNLNGIKSVANKNTIQLINNLIKKYNSTIEMSKEFKNLPTGINGIVYEKIYPLEKSNVKISITNGIKNNVIEELSAKDYNLFCEAIGVGLDNAIDAIKDSKEKILYITITEIKESITMNIINKFSGSIDIDSLGNKNYTTKIKGHGIGLFSIMKFNTVKVFTTIKGNKFIYSVKVNKQKKENYTI